jgi:hypothetical protein
VIGCNWKQCDVPGALDRFGNLPLMGCTVAGDAAWYDFAAFGYKKTKCARLFVINGQILLGTKTAYFTTLKWPSFPGAAWAACRTLAWAACRTLI